MTVLLSMIGFITAAVGLITIGFGIPINSFSLGNTLIVAGAVGLCTGLILIALGLILGQLRRIAQALRQQPIASAGAEPAAKIKPSVVVPTPAPEPRVAAPTAEPAAAPAALDWLRSKPKAGAPRAAEPPAPEPSLPEPPMMELPDEAPLSPQRPPVLPAIDPTRDLRPSAPARETGAGDFRPPPRQDRQQEVAKDKERFNLMWPDRAPGGRSAAKAEPTLESAEPASDPLSPPLMQPPSFEPTAEAPAAEPVRSESKPEPKFEPNLDLKRPSGMPLPPVPARPRDGIRIDKRLTETLRKPVERGPAILKSGVIDGMPYTLYADGSIEAQLPNGTVKFASVDALRGHLEKQG